VQAAIEGEHRRIKREASKRAIDHSARDALRLRVARHRGKETVEVPATLGRAHWRG
jgi:hypothetical protein